ncbi:hypothetical protein cyc_07223 [Cyclospora cayetanensis]|uniref:Uncharacterized protein n=1 Tax=Cyclospora cayetanensis TaxID=88456 RepID=A0A1D3D0G6_9EIME|nr:hypothetical protein cyc_07223 [Cyclospora cayetanensis]
MDVCINHAISRERPSSLARLYADPRGRAVRCFAVSQTGAVAAICLEPYSAAALAAASEQCKTTRGEGLSGSSAPASKRPSETLPKSSEAQARRRLQTAEPLQREAAAHFLHEAESSPRSASSVRERKNEQRAHSAEHFQAASGRDPLEIPKEAKNSRHTEAASESLPHADSPADEDSYYAARRLRSRAARKAAASASVAVGGGKNSRSESPSAAPVCLQKSSSSPQHRDAELLPLRDGRGRCRDAAAALKRSPWLFESAASSWETSAASESSPGCGKNEEKGALLDEASSGYLPAATTLVTGADDPRVASRPQRQLPLRLSSPPAVQQEDVEAGCIVLVDTRHLLPASAFAAVAKAANAAKTALTTAVEGHYPQRLARLELCPPEVVGGSALAFFRLLRLGKIGSEAQHAALLSSQWVIDAWGGPTCSVGREEVRAKAPLQGEAEGFSSSAAGDKAAAEAGGFGCNGAAKDDVFSAEELVQTSHESPALLFSLEEKDSWDRDPLSPRSLPPFGGPYCYAEALLQFSGAPPLRLLLDFSGKRTLRCVSLLSLDLALSCLTFAAPAAGAPYDSKGGSPLEPRDVREGERLEESSPPSLGGPPVAPERGTGRLKKGTYAIALFKYTVGCCLQFTSGVYRGNWATSTDTEELSSAPAAPAEGFPKSISQLQRDFPVAAFHQQLQTEGRPPLVPLPPLPAAAAASASSSTLNAMGISKPESDCGRWLVAIVLPCGMIVQGEGKQGQQQCRVQAIMDQQQPAESMQRQRHPQEQHEEEVDEERHHEGSRRSEEGSSRSCSRSASIGPSPSARRCLYSREKKGLHTARDLLQGKGLAGISSGGSCERSGTSISGGGAAQRGLRCSSLSASRAAAAEEKDLLSLRVQGELPVGARYGQSGAKMERFSILTFSKDPMLQWLAIVSRKGITEKVLYFLHLKAPGQRGVSLKELRLETAFLPMILQMEWIPRANASLLVLPEHRRFLGCLRHVSSPHSEVCFVQPYIHFPPCSSNKQDLEAPWDFDLGSSSSSGGSEAEESGLRKRRQRSERGSPGRRHERLSCLHNHLALKTQGSSLEALRSLQGAPPSAWLSLQEAERQQQPSGPFRHRQSFSAFAASLGGRKQQDAQRDAQLALLYASYLRGETLQQPAARFPTDFLLRDNDLCQPLYRIHGVYGPSAFPSAPCGGGSGVGGCCCCVERLPRGDLIDVSQPMSAWGYVEAALQMQVDRKGGALHADRRRPDTPTSRRSAARLLRVAGRLRAILQEPRASPDDPQRPLSLDKAPQAQEEIAPQAIGKPSSGSPAIRATTNEDAHASRRADLQGSCPHWRLQGEIPNGVEAAGAAAAAGPVPPLLPPSTPRLPRLQDVLASLRRKQPASSLPPALRHSRPTLPTRFSLAELLTEKDAQLAAAQAMSEADSPDTEWWNRLRMLASSRGDCRGAGTREPEALAGGHASQWEECHLQSAEDCEALTYDDLVKAQLYWGDPLVLSGRKYRNNWQLPVVWGSELPEEAT